jgi:hypothetical protein
MSDEFDTTFKNKQISDEFASTLNIVFLVTGEQIKSSKL